MRSDNKRLLRADLHVHSCRSGYSGQLKFLRARECYSEPEAVYATAKARGMDVVTITDHDSIDGCLEFLDHHPDADDFFISEEIECRFPDVKLKVHIGAYDINERIHREIQPLRRNLSEATAYLRSEGILYALNHPFFFFKGQVSLEQYLSAALQLFPAFEVRNGTRSTAHNLLTETIVQEWATASAVPLVLIGGSDSHTLSGIGSTYTEVSGSNRQEFLQNLRAGRAGVGGRHGGTFREAREIYGVVTKYWASLLGFGRQDLSWRRRALGLAFSAVSMPFEFTPLLVAALDNRAEVQRVAAYGREWEFARSKNNDVRVVVPADEFDRLLVTSNRTAEPLQ